MGINLEMTNRAFDELQRTSRSAFATPAEWDAARRKWLQMRAALMPADEAAHLKYIETYVCETSGHIARRTVKVHLGCTNDECRTIESCDCAR